MLGILPSAVCGARSVKLSLLMGLVPRVWSLIRETSHPSHKKIKK